MRSNALSAALNPVRHGGDMSERKGELHVRRRSWKQRLSLFSLPAKEIENLRSSLAEMSQYFHHKKLNQ
jgi:hypothetical protein